MIPALPLLLFSLWFSVFDPCDASPAESITTNVDGERSCISLFSQAGTELSVTKRRVPIRPQASKPFSAVAVNINTIRLFKFDFVFTDQALDELVTAMRKWTVQIIAVMLNGMELERHVVAVHVGAFTLNLYAVMEALSQGIVLAVVRRLVQLFETRMGFVLGEGVVVVGAGVRVLFAVGIRLQGFGDLNREVVQPLMGLIG